jgi:hypothetical protein
MSHIKLTCKYLVFQAIRFKFHDQIKQRPISFQSVIPEPRKAINVYAHHDNLRSFAQLAISVPDRRNGLTSDCTHSQPTNAYKKQWAPERRSLTQQKIMLFTRVAPRTKSKGLSIDGPLLSKKRMLFTSVAPRTKSKGLPIGGPLLSKNLYFLDA